jgi:hypothetical protein
MKRILLLMAVSLVVAAMIVAMAMPAFARGGGHITEIPGGKGQVGGSGGGGCGLSGCHHGGSR